MPAYHPAFILMPNGSEVADIVIVTDNQGTVLRLVTLNEWLPNPVQHLDGLLIPGLINAHSHLELAWCRELLRPGLGMSDFYAHMQGIHRRRPDDDTVKEFIKKEIAQHISRGVVAMADVSNTLITLDEKKKSGMYFHTFAETFGLENHRATEKFAFVEALAETMNVGPQMQSTISAHTLFTLSDALLRMLMDSLTASGHIHTIHFLESREECNWFEKAEPIQSIHVSNDINKGSSTYRSLEEIIDRWVPWANRVLFVHNTFINAEILQRLTNALKHPYFCLCPSSNQFITGELPPVRLLENAGVRIVVGTDSAASAKELDMLRELSILLEMMPEKPVGAFISDITRHAAAFLGISGVYGSFEPKKRPGLVLLEGYRPGCRNLASLSVRRII